jgi:nucleotide-binding universal stress UspA family protein
VFSNVLVATDGSECAERALESAIDMVKVSNGKLTIMHVLELPPTVGIGKTLTAKVVRFYTNDAKAFLEEQQHEAKTRGVDAGTILAKSGSPAKAILSTAKSRKMDLIVVGSRGLGGVKGLLLGSVSNAIVHSAKISVLVTK